MSDVWFTSDWHLGHDYIAQKRGFKDVEVHDLAVVDSMLDLTKRDVLWVLGDIFHTEDSFKWMAMLDPRMGMRAILGNHDEFSTERYLGVFDWVGGAQKVKDFWLTHIPIHPQEMFRAVGNIHGHIHEYGSTDCIGHPYVNVNWDYWKRPVSLTEIREISKQHD